MNERIQKLTVQAEEWVCKNYPDAMDDNDEFHAQTMAKFAELIVRECLDIVNRKEYSYHEADPLWETAQLIKEHFGVEEQVQDSKELHTCPYREEIHNDHESLCDCDEEQQHQCAMDI